MKNKGITLTTAEEKQAKVKTTRVQTQFRKFAASTKRDRKARDFDFLRFITLTHLEFSPVDILAYTLFFFLNAAITAVPCITNTGTVFSPHY